MTPVYFSPEAEDDLKDIWQYYAGFDVDAADRMIDKINRVRVRLSDHPFSGRARDDLVVGLRSMPVLPYLIFHRVQLDAVEVVRVLHGARDLGSILSE
jgi:toxin ParE1/3/4